MRDVYLAVTLEFIINTFNVKQIDSQGYLPIKDSIACINKMFLSIYLCKYPSSLERLELKV